MHTQIDQQLESKLATICINSINSTADSLQERIRRLITKAGRYYALARQRHALSQLSDHQLKDIGITRVDAMQEAAKPFWQE
jgi:uncharacterized protein YjiS (DUF1127 family)